MSDELVLATARDTHRAWADRLHAALRRPTRGGSRIPEPAHRALAAPAAAGTSLALQAAALGLLGDRLHRERQPLAISMSVRAGGRDVGLDEPGLREAFPDATGRIVVFLHGLCENEDYWRLGRGRLGTTYGEMLAERGWTPVFLRANTGLSLRENGVELATLMQRLVGAWLTGVARIARVGHSLGGLVIRAGGAVATPGERSWTDRVTDVVTLGTPHLGAPIAQGLGHGSRMLARLPEAAAFGRILDHRSVGIHDLVAGLAHDVAPLPHARYRLVSATLTRSPRHLLGAVVGDLLVQVPSAYGRPSRRRAGAEGELFPGADAVHLGGTDHFTLRNPPGVHRALRDWLA
ncbi:esterase/lipase family protein [Nocardioides pacificus]